MVDVDPESICSGERPEFAWTFASADVFTIPTAALTKPGQWSVLYSYTGRAHASFFSVLPTSPSLLFTTHPLTTHPLTTHDPLTRHPGLYMVGPDLRKAGAVTGAWHGGGFHQPGGGGLVAGDETAHMQRERHAEGERERERERRTHTHARTHARTRARTHARTRAPLPLAGKTYDLVLTSNFVGNTMQHHATPCNTMQHHAGKTYDLVLTSNFVGNTNSVAVGVSVIFDGTPLRGQMEGPVGWVPDNQVGPKP
jgi:hypothetical protein